MTVLSYDKHVVVLMLKSTFRNDVDHPFPFFLSCDVYYSL